MKDIKNYRPISLLSHLYKLFTWKLQKRMEKVLGENQPRKEAGFRKGYSVVDHLQTISQLIEKCNNNNSKPNFIVQFDTSSILTLLYIVIKCI